MENANLPNLRTLERRERERVSSEKRDDGGGLNQEKENGRMKSVGRRQQKLESWGAVWLFRVH